MYPYRIHWVKYLSRFPYEWMTKAQIKPIPSKRSKSLFYAKGMCYVGPKNCLYPELQKVVVEKQFATNYLASLNSMLTGISAYEHIENHSHLFQTQEFFL